MHLIGVPLVSLLFIFYRLTCSLSRLRTVRQALARPFWAICIDFWCPARPCTLFPPTSML